MINNCQTYRRKVNTGGKIDNDLAIFFSLTPHDSVYHSLLCMKIISESVMLLCLCGMTRETAGFKLGVRSRKGEGGSDLLCKISCLEQEDRQRSFLRTGRMAEGRAGVEAGSARDGPEPASC